MTNDITTIDAALAELQQRRAPIDAALAKARELQQSPAAPDPEIEQERRRTVADWLLGRASRSAVEKAEQRAEKNRQERDRAAREAELARLGEDELRALLQPFDAEAARLAGQRRALVAETLRMEAVKAAEDYKERLIEAGRAQAKAKALAALAVEHDATPPIRWPVDAGQITATAVAEGAGDVFPGWQGTFSVFIGDGLVVHRPDEAVVPVSPARAAVHAELREKGLLP